MADEPQEAKSKKGLKIREWPLFKKLKSIKHIQIVVVVVLCAVALLLYFSTFSSKKSTSGTQPEMLSDYAKELEDKLNHVLSVIKGAGKVDVLVTLEGSSELKIAYSTEERRTTTTTGSGATQTVTENVIIIQTPILINKNGTTSPLVLLEIKPQIKGIIIVAQGADDIKVRLELLRAAQAVLKIDVSCIEIFTGK